MQQMRFDALHLVGVEEKGRHSKKRERPVLSG